MKATNNSHTNPSPNPNHNPSTHLNPTVLAATLAAAADTQPLDPVFFVLAAMQAVTTMYKTLHCTDEEAYPDFIDEACVLAGICLKFASTETNRKKFLEQMLRNAADIRYESACPSTEDELDGPF